MKVYEVLWAVALVVVACLTGCYGEQVDVESDVGGEMLVEMGVDMDQADVSDEPRLAIFDASATDIGVQVLAAGKLVGASGAASTHAVVMARHDGWSGALVYQLLTGEVESAPVDPQLTSVITKVYRLEDCTGPVYLPDTMAIHMVWEDQERTQAALWRTLDGVPYLGPRYHYGMVAGGEMKCIPYPGESGLFAAELAPQSWSYLTGTPPFALYNVRD